MGNKLALFVPSLRGGGAERVMVNLARGFADRGLKVDLVLAKGEGLYLSQVPDKVRLVDLRAKRMASALPPLMTYLRREKPRSFLSAMMHTNVIAILARKLAKVDTRIVISEHSTLSISSRNAKSLRERYLPLIAKRIYPWADMIVAVSKGVADDLVCTLGLPRERIGVIYNPIVTPELLEKAKETVKHPWFQPGGPPVILGVGRLTKPKDFPTLLRAFASVRKEGRSRLVILGGGEERPNLEALAEEFGIAEDVDIPGFVENPYKYMACARVFVLSSRWEGFGNVIVEAMACGTPVVSTDCPSGPAEILEDGRYGELVPVGDYEALARSILSTLDNPISTSVLQQRARDFSVEKIADQYIDVLVGFQIGR